LQFIFVPHGRTDCRRDQRHHRHGFLDHAGAGAGLAVRPEEAVPIMAVAAVMGNFSRNPAWWREVDWRATLAYSITGVPAAALGAKTLLVLPRTRSMSRSSVSARDDPGTALARGA